MPMGRIQERDDGILHICPYGSDTVQRSVYEAFDAAIFFKTPVSVIPLCRCASG
jgi:hypothetical protein